MAVAFPGNQFKGEIVPALVDLVESGTIRILDLAFVIKDGDGNVAAMELNDLASDAGKAFAALEAAAGDLLNEEDLMAIGDALELNSSAAVLVWEDLWAGRLASALHNAGGVLLNLERVPHEVAQAAMDYVQNKAAVKSA